MSTGTTVQTRKYQAAHLLIPHGKAPQTVRTHASTKHKQVCATESTDLLRLYSPLPKCLSGELHQNDAPTPRSLDQRGGTASWPSRRQGQQGFRLRGGGSIEPPKIGGRGVWEEGSIDRTINQLF